MLEIVNQRGGTDNTHFVDPNRLFSGSTRFYIPPHQRLYAWEIKQVDQLFKDIEKAITFNSLPYFMGIIYTENPDWNEIKEVEDQNMVTKLSDMEGLYPITDGQQRITTIYLIILSAYKIARENKDKQLMEDLKSIVMDQYNDPRVYLTSSINNALETLIFKNATTGKDIGDIEGCGGAHESQMKLVDNYNHIYAKLKDMENMSEFIDTLNNKVNFIQIRITKDDNSNVFALFDGINNRGVKLSDVDIFKNQIFELVADSESDKKNVRPKMRKLLMSWSKIVKELSYDEFEKVINHSEFFDNALSNRKNLSAVINDSNIEIKNLVSDAGWTSDDALGYISRIEDNIDIWKFALREKGAVAVSELTFKLSADSELNKYKYNLAYFFNNTSEDVWLYTRFNLILKIKNAINNNDQKQLKEISKLMSKINDAIALSYAYNCGRLFVNKDRYQLSNDTTIAGLVSKIDNYFLNAFKIIRAGKYSDLGEVNDKLSEYHKKQEDGKSFAENCLMHSLNIIDYSKGPAIKAILGRIPFKDSETIIDEKMIGLITNNTDMDHVLPKAHEFWKSKSEEIGNEAASKYKNSISNLLLESNSIQRKEKFEKKVQIYSKYKYDYYNYVAGSILSVSQGSLKIIEHNKNVINLLIHKIVNI